MILRIINLLKSFDIFDLISLPIRLPAWVAMCIANICFEFFTFRWLHLATRFRSRKLTEMCLNYGITPTSSNLWGESPINMASVKLLPVFTEFLLSKSASRRVREESLVRALDDLKTYRLAVVLLKSGTTPPMTMRKNCPALDWILFDTYKLSYSFDPFYTNQYFEYNKISTYGITPVVFNDLLVLLANYGAKFSPDHKNHVLINLWSHEFSNSTAKSQKILFPDTIVALAKAGYPLENEPSGWGDNYKTSILSKIDFRQLCASSLTKSLIQLGATVNPVGYPRDQTLTNSILAKNTDAARILIHHGACVSSCRWLNEYMSLWEWCVIQLGKNHEFTKWIHNNYHSPSEDNAKEGAHEAPYTGSHSSRNEHCNNSHRFKPCDSPTNKRLKCLKTLGLNYNATKEEIRMAFLKLSVVHHPDKHHYKGKSVEAKQSKIFARILYAYDYLQKI